MDIAYIASVAGFLASGMLYVGAAPGGGVVTKIAETETLLLSTAQANPTQTTDLPELFLQPDNAVSWMLLIVLWGLLLLDAADRLLQPEDQRSRPELLPLCVALIVGAIWPWIYRTNVPVAVLGAILMVTSALAAAMRDASTRRPAVGFFAGWSTGLGLVTATALIAGRLELTIVQAAIAVILLGAAIGIVAQYRLDHRVSYSVAVIWVFCGLAVATMGGSMAVALAAILAISGMSVMLIRAAS
ncbi:hypothetical protein JJJ17_01840 [Paracoccus caeni]|uniref:Uncharacterized protein n=1 Tax=Paracoccus caeni TaxID=657651 RepID=A0A934SB24_9RHOB|nr:hypothetical protein [Paracoccus caeni]MBK4214662.1 hypothetical protein [Paracoccus caeni]